METNLLGDVVAIYSEAGVKLYSYVYDAWGNLILGTEHADGGEEAAAVNPFRYRSYYYDEEIGMYYLNARYYSPEMCRFISPDGQISGIGGDLRGYNMYAYCFNNPVNMIDPEGNWPKLSSVLAVVAISAAVVAVVAVTIASCGTAAPALVTAGGGILSGLSAGTVATATSVATHALIVSSVAAAATVASAAIEDAESENIVRNNSVYVLKDDSGTVQYVGRTNNVERRRSAHNSNPARAGLHMEVIASGLSLQEARALEQAGMAYHHTINTANKMNNQINSVSPQYWDAYKTLALGILDYGWNQVSNEILYWTGN